MPLVDGGVILHARIAALPCGFRNLAQQFTRVVALYRMAVFNGTRKERFVALHGVHKVIGHAHGVVGVRKEDEAMALGARPRTVIAGSTSAHALASSLALHSTKS